MDPTVEDVTVINKKKTDIEDIQVNGSEKDAKAGELVNGEENKEGKDSKKDGTEEDSEAEDEDYDSDAELQKKVSKLARKKISLEEVGTTAEIIALDERPDDRGKPRLIERDDYYDSNSKPGYYSKYCIVTKRVFDGERKYEKSTVQINSPQIRKILKEVVPFYPSEPKSFDETINIDSPFSMLFHYRKEVLEYPTEDETTKAHLKVFQDFVDIELGESIAEAEKLISAGFITFDLLYTIFKPGDLIYNKDNGHPELSILTKSVYGKTDVGGKYFALTLAFTGHDGTRTGRAKTEFRIQESCHCKGVKQIMELPMFPLKVLGKEIGEGIKQQLIKRGEKYLAHTGIKVARYDGAFKHLKTPPDDYYNEEAEYSGVWVPGFTTGRILLDPKTFTEDNKKAAYEIDVPLTDAQKAFLAPSPKHAVLDHPDIDPMLCPSYIYGYDLVLRKWGRFYVDQISDPAWKPNPFDDLVFDPTQKRIIKSLVNSHQFPEKARDEEAQKGKGLIMLLHGAPGVGKTLTAEVVAEHTKRALLKVSTSELGSYEWDVGPKVRKLLRLATTWKAIVLIDEADVFLEQREIHSHRNATVAAFLHELEYFHGIMFLTSNRVSTFDPAIKSRIHLALQYLPPTREIRKAIWKNRMKIVPKECLAYETEAELDKALTEIAEHDMNGREIANAINTGLTLAKDEGGKLSLDHLMIMVKAWKTFEKALNESKLMGDIGFDRKKDSEDNSWYV